MTTTQRCGQLFSEERHTAGRNTRRAPQLSVAPRLERSPAREHRWAIILSGRESSLEQARQLAQRSVPSEQTIVTFTRAQESFCLPQLVRTVCQRLVEPCDRGTAPAILSGLLQIAKANPDAYIAILPSDHSYSDEDAFTRALETAFANAAAHPESVVLLGAPPCGPEVERQWIELGAAVPEHLFQVEAFQEKPALASAEQMLRSGALWNTSVLAGHLSAFLRIAGSVIPDLVRLLGSSLTEIRDYPETRIPDRVYDAIAPCDFSRQVLAPGAGGLLAMRLEHTEWRDLNHPAGVTSALLAQNGLEVPGWLQGWEAGKTRDMQRPTILLVDDDAAVRSFTQALLEKTGYRVLTAENGSQALRLFETHRSAIGLLLTDFRMPILNGCELADRVRQINAGVPVLVMTGDGPAVPPGYEFIQKPLKPAELIRHVGRVIDSSNARKGIAPALIAS